MIPVAPDYERHLERNIPLHQIWEFINPFMFYGRHLGFPGEVIRKIQKEGVEAIQVAHPRLAEIWKNVQNVMLEYEKSEVLRPSAVYQYFPAAGQGNHVYLYSSPQGGIPIADFEFLRQQSPDGTEGLCLADYVAPTKDPKSEFPQDNLAFFVTSVGHHLRSEVERLKNEGQYLKTHILQALAVESAEAYAEELHSRIRAGWKHADPSTLTKMELFQAKYRGKRYSFGHSACPRLEDQTTLFRLLRPEEIGVQLTEGFMMDPEASVSAIVFHHPEAKYFSVHAGFRSDSE